MPGSTGIGDNGVQSYNLRFVLREDPAATLIVRDVLGKVVTSQSYEHSKQGKAVAFDLSGRPAGVYILTVQNKVRKVSSRIVKSK